MSCDNVSFICRPKDDDGVWPVSVARMIYALYFYMIVMDSQSYSYVSVYYFAFCIVG